jgi:sulfoxide reductase heme-binding subunit YedZ
MTTSAGTHLFWITSRAAGTSAMILASATVAFGLAMSGRLLKGSLSDRRTVHEILSLSVMVAIAVHAISLLGDGYVRATVLDVTLPFAFAYKQLSYYLRGRIGPARWRSIHRFTLLAWLGALMHAFTEGTDAGQTWFVALILITAAPAFLALALKLRTTRRNQWTRNSRPPRTGGSKPGELASAASV